MERATDDRFERIINSTRRKFEQSLFSAINDKLSDNARGSLDALLEEKSDTAEFRRLRADIIVATTGHLNPYRNFEFDMTKRLRVCPNKNLSISQSYNSP